MGSRPARADLIIPELIEQYGQDVDVATIDPEVDGDALTEWVGIWGLIIADAAEAALTDTDNQDGGTAPSQDVPETP